MSIDELVQAVRVLYPSAMRGNDYTANVTAGVATLALWNNALGEQPTSDQLTTTLLAVQLSEAKQTQLNMLAAAYSAATASDVAYMSTTFAADQQSQQIFGQALTVYNVAGAVPTGFFTADAAGNKVTMTLDQLKGLCNSIADQVWTSFQRWVAVRESLATATTVASVQAITW